MKARESGSRINEHKRRIKGETEYSWYFHFAGHAMKGKTDLGLDTHALIAAW
jgi:hypothetical protein